MGATAEQERRGSLDEALKQARALAAERPDLAALQCREILAAAPGQPDAALLLAGLERRAGRPSAALAVLAPVLSGRSNFGPGRYEEGLALAALGRTQEAVRSLERAVALGPDFPHAWRALADQLRLADDPEGADRAYARHLKASARDPQLMTAAEALCDGRLAVAEQALRDRLKAQPTDVAAIRMLAEVGARLGRLEEAQALLERVVELAPGFAAARHNLALVLFRQNKAAEAVAECDRLLAAEPKHPGYAVLRAAALGRIGEYQAAIEGYEAVLAAYPEQPKAWMSLGHALKTVGRQADSVAAYRRAIALRPQLGEAWWSLANLKTVRFDDSDLEAMRGALERTDLDAEDRFHLHFALGKALEDREAFAVSFEHYAAGNRLRREGLDYVADETRRHVERSIRLFTPEFFAARTGQGCPAPDPIFVVGLPRAGSTLVEQILSSHSRVEGTMELPDLISMARRLGGRRKRSEESRYPEVLATLSADDLRALGEEWLERTRVQRKTDKPIFIDKMPNNWAHVGLIALILPNAKIVDARRHPMGCCFSGFKQHFARGQGFTYDLEDVGRYYADYVELMARFDQALPGRAHRVIYERMVADTEAEVRALLDYCGLPFEDACLRFWETDRAVRTASSEQVRRPIFTDAAEHWRRYEPWLEPLKTALGPVLDAYPEAPAYRW